jgi:hypothetical protein
MVIVECVAKTGGCFIKAKECERKHKEIDTDKQQHNNTMCLQ